MAQRRSRLIAASAGLAIAALALTGCASGASSDGGAGESSDAFTMGTQPWLGYGQWYVAEDQGFFDERGVSVDISNFDNDADMNAALAAGHLDMANVGSQAALQFVEQGLDVSIVMVLDSATTADAIIAGEGIDSIEGLKGKRVAFEEGATSEILLAEALEQSGLDPQKDIEIVPAGADQVASMLLSGNVDAGVTYEPYVSQALATDDALQVVQSAEDYPGLISDVLVVRNEVLADRGDEVREVIAAWGDAMGYFEANTSEGREIIAKAVGESAADLETAFDGVHFYTIDENRDILEGSFANETLPSLAEVAKRIGLISGEVDAASIIDSSYLGE